jgi:hypothetical protein
LFYEFSPPPRNLSGKSSGLFELHHVIGAKHPVDVEQQPHAFSHLGHAQDVVGMILIGYQFAEIVPQRKRTNSIELSS